MKSRILFVCATLSATLVPHARASTVEDLIRLNQVYSREYFQYLQEKKGGQRLIQAEEERLNLLRPAARSAQEAYMAPFRIYEGLGRELAQIPGRIESSRIEISGAQARISSSKTQVVAKGYFPNADAVTSESANAALAQRLTEIDRLQNEINQLNGRIAEIKIAPDYLSHLNEMKASKEDLERAERRVRDLTGRKSRLQSDLENEQSAIDSLLNQISSMDSRRTSLERNVLPQLRDQSRRADEILQDFSNQLFHIRNDIAVQEPAAREMYNRLNRLFEKRRDLRARVQEASQDLERVQRRLDQINAQRPVLQDLVQTKLPAAQSHAQVKIREAEEATRAFTESNQKVTQIRSRLEAQDKEIARLQNERNNQAGKQGQLKLEAESIGQALSQVPALQAQRDQIAAQIQQRNDQLSKVEANLAKQRMELQTRRAELKSFQDQHGTMRARMQEAEGQVRSLQGQIQQLRGKIAELKAQAQALPQMRVQFKELTAQRDSIRAVVQEAQAALTAAAQELKDAQAELAKAQEAPGTDQEKAPAIRAARQKVQAASAKVAPLREKVQTHRAQLQPVQEKLEALKAQIDALATVTDQIRKLEGEDLARLTGDLKAQQTIVAQLKELLNENGELARLKTAVDEAEATVQKSEQQKTNITNSIANLGKQKSQMEAALAKLEEQAGRKKQIEATELPRILAAIQALDRDLAAKKSESERDAAELRSLETGLQTAKTRKAQADQALETAKKALADLTQRKNDLEKDVNEAPRLTERRNDLSNTILPQLNRELGAVERDHEVLDRDYNVSRRRLEDLRNRKEDVERRGDEAQTRARAAAAELNEKQDELDRLRRQIDVARSEATKRQNRRAEIATALSQAGTDLTRAQADVGPARTRAQKNRDRYDAFYSSRISPIENDLAQRLTAQAAEQTQAQDLRDLIQVLTRENAIVSGSEENIRGLESRTASLSEQIANLEPALASLKQEWENAEGLVKEAIEAQERVRAELKTKHEKLKSLEAQQDQAVRELAQAGRNE